MTDVPYHAVNIHSGMGRQVKVKSIAIMTMIALLVAVGYDQYKTRKA